MDTGLRRYDGILLSHRTCCGVWGYGENAAFWPPDVATHAQAKRGEGAYVAQKNHGVFLIVTPAKAGVHNSA
ncbi:MAG: hypothetical protein K2Q01_09850 [Rickettsiales bacterium]|nr:hypothetical protein [Rickettsiales bacterium]